MKITKNNEKTRGIKGGRSKEQTITLNKKKREKIEKKKEASDKGLGKGTENKYSLRNIVHFLDKHSGAVMAILTLFLFLVAIFQLITMENQNRINERQTAIMDDQKNISRELFNLQKSKTPRPVLFIEPESDYCLGTGEDIATFPSLSKTLSIHENETFTLTLVNAGSGPLNIKGVWSMYKCRNTKTDEIFWHFPSFLNESKGRFTKVDNKVVAKVFESNVIMPDEKMSSTIVIGFEDDIAKCIGDNLDDYVCDLYFNIFYSYEGVEFDQRTEKIDFEWSEREYSCYQKPAR